MGIEDPNGKCQNCVRLKKDCRFGMSAQLLDALQPLSVP